MDPRSCGAISRLKSPNLAVALQGQRNLVEALQESLAATRIDLEGVPLTGWRGDRPRLEIDADLPCPLRRFNVGSQGVNDLFVSDDRKNAVLKTVGKKDVSKTGADDGAGCPSPAATRPLLRGRSHSRNSDL